MSTLSDGVFAIAMTLLVLDLRPPEVGPIPESWSFASGLVDQLAFPVVAVELRHPLPSVDRAAPNFAFGFDSPIESVSLND